MNILCRDINGSVHIVDESELVPRTSVYGLIIAENRVLLVRDRTTAERTWDVPGGGVDPGEGLIDALCREIKEETDLDVLGEPERLCEFTEYFYDVGSQSGWKSIRHFFLTSAQGTPRLAGNGDDVVEAQRFSLTDLPTEAAPVARMVLAMVPSR